MNVSLRIPDEIVDEVQTEALAEFEALSRVYRPSFKTRAIADYIKQRVKELDPSITVYEDAYRSNLVNDANDEKLSSGNIWFDIPANLPNLQENQPIILQAHMDMVCAFADDEAKAQLEEFGVELEYHSNDTLTSMGKRTSLGADNGIGIAVMLGILKTKNFKHGPIRCLLTTDEEEGMIGASYTGLTRNGDKGSPVQGFKYLINNDNSFDGEIIVSTAGAVVSFFMLPPDVEAKPIESGLNALTLTVSGGSGGHDGDWAAYHANAIRLVGETLKNVSTQPEFRLVDFASPDSAGSNVIHTKSYATFVSKATKEDIEKIIADNKQEYERRYPQEKNLVFEVVEAQLPENTTISPLSHDNSARVIKLLNALPCGLVSWKDRSIQWVETSGNMGPIYIRYTKEDKDGKKVWIEPSFELQTRCRSCNNEHIEKIMKDNKAAAKEILGGDDLDYYQMRNMYYGWPGDKDDKFLNIAKTSFSERGVKWSTRHLLGGLEVSWFKHFNPDLNILSIGAEIHDMHSVNETLYTGTLRGVIGVTLDCIAQMRWIEKTL